MIKTIFTTIAISAMLAVCTATPASAHPPDCYIAASGDCVERPDSNHNPGSIPCRDGTFSHAEHRSGACSHHGGIE